MKECRKFLLKFIRKLIKITPEIGREIFRPTLTKEQEVELVEKQKKSEGFKFKV